MTREEAVSYLEFEREQVLNKSDGITSNLTEAYDMAIEALQEPERKWIPVSERLPKEYETVIGVTYLNYCCIAMYCKEYGFRSMDVGVEGDIIAWQPLPEPYKAGEQE